MNHIFSYSLLAAILFFTTAFGQNQTGTASLYKRPVPEWYKNARFGMFIHCGLCSKAVGYWNGKPNGEGNFPLNAGPTAPDAVASVVVLKIKGRIQPD